jgi:phosphoribosylglycinamide formyltransferase-1
MQELFNIVVLISGRGTNLQALIDASHRSSYKISAVISNKAQAIGLNRAEISGIDTYVIEQESFDSKLEFEESLATRISEINPKLIVLAGFMKVLGPQFVKLFRGKIINIHPSLLPEYPGLNTHQRVLEDNKKIHGVSVHLVTEDLDGGPIIAQDSVHVLPNDTAESLAKRVLEREHIIYPKVVESLAIGKIQLSDYGI